MPSMSTVLPSSTRAFGWMGAVALAILVLTNLVDVYLDGDTGELLECEVDSDPFGSFTESEATDVSAKAVQLAGDADALSEAGRERVEDYAVSLRQ